MKTIIFTDTEVRLLADSALARNKQPWFLPDYGRNWRWRAAKAVRISRLGKGIRPEFAARYADAYTMLWLPMADENPAADFMDGAAVAGEWLPLDGSLDPQLMNLIVTASRFATLKTGDVIAAVDPAFAPAPIEINQHIELEIAGRQVWNFNIK